MEVVGFSLSVVALASLFSTCVECWEYVESARSHGRDYELLATQLEVEKTRFLIWGDVVGVLKSSESERDEVLNHPRVAPVVERILNHIISIFSDSEGLTSKYGLMQEQVDRDESKSATLSANQLSRYKVSYKQFLAQVKTVQQRTSLLRKIRWAIRDRSKFGVLVDEVRQLVDSLKDITESSTNKLHQRQHNAIAEEINSLPDLSMVRLVKDATATIHQDWSDTATEVLETSTLGKEDKEYVLDWINTADNVDLGYEKAQETLTEAGLDANARGFENLHWAAIYGHDDVVRFLLDHGVNIDARDPKLRTPLLQATQAGKTSTIQLLIDRGANSEARALDLPTPLNVATNAGHTEVVRQLLKNSIILDARDEDSRTPLIRAAQLGDYDITLELLAKGAQIEARTTNGCTALGEAAWADHREVLELLIEWGAEVDCIVNGRGTPLLEASRFGHLAVVYVLLEHCANMEAAYDEARTPLSWAVKEGHTEIVRLLLAHGAYLETRSYQKETPLLEAAWWPRVEIVKLLLEYGSNLEVRIIGGNGHTSLIRASLRGNEENVKALIEGGCKINAVDYYGNTAVMLAVQNGQASIVQYLTSKGADITLINHWGRNVLHLVSRSGDLEIAEHLVSQGRISVDCQDHYGETARLVAARFGHHQIVELLLKHGASKKTPNSLGETPMLLAIRNGHAEVTRVPAGTRVTRSLSQQKK